MSPFSIVGDLLGEIWHVISSAFGLLQVPVSWLLVNLTLWFARFPVTGGIGGFGLAVIIVTLAIRLALMPIFAWQMKAQVKMQEDAAKLKAPLAELRRKYGKDRAGMVAAQQELYKEHGMSPMAPLAGCLPVLVQAPVLFGLYGGIRAAVQELPLSDRGFLWLSDVSKSGIDLCCKSGGSVDYSRLLSSHWTVMILPIMAALLTVVQSKMMLPAPSPNPTDQEKMQQQIGRTTTFAIPGVILVTGLNFPAGLAIYWVTQSSFMVAQQHHMLGWGNMVVPRWFPGARRRTPLAIRKLAAASNKKVETIEREHARALQLESPSSSGSSSPGRDGAPGDPALKDGGPGTGVAAGMQRTTGRAKSRAARPQNRKRRR